MKKIINSLILSFFTICVFAQNIELPDITTVIEGESMKAGVDSILESENPIIFESGSGDIVPDLPEEIEEVETEQKIEKIKTENPKEKKGLHVNGLVGGGYPTAFTGDFSLFNSDKKNPFKLDFLHNSAVGYAGHSLSEGFYDRNTRFYISKGFTKEKYNCGFGGSYSDVSNGLQNHVEGISSLNLDLYNGNGYFLYKFEKGFSAGVKTGVNFYNRYEDVTKGESPSLSFLSINPDIFINWKNDNINAGFSCDYIFGKDCSSNFDDIINRVKFNINFSWHNSFVNAYADAGAVVGNFLNDNSVVVPFKAGVNAFIPVSFSSNKLCINAEGGIDSKLPMPYELETNYKYTTVQILPHEESDWYGKIKIAIPVGESFTGTFATEYRKTAFNNAKIMADYSLLSLYGSYFYKIEELQQLNTDFLISYRMNSFVFTGMWKSYWLDVPVLKNENTVGFIVAYDNKDFRIGGEISGKIAMNQDVETPDLGLKIFVKVTDSVKTELQINDAIKLIKAEPRVYAGEYIGRGGNASLLLKFNF